MNATQQRACSEGMRRFWRRRHAGLRRQMEAVAAGRVDHLGTAVEFQDQTITLTPHDWWHILQKCRQVLKPRWERGTKRAHGVPCASWNPKRWYIWRDAQGRQIHAALDETNLPLNVVQTALETLLSGSGDRAQSADQRGLGQSALSVSADEAHEARPSPAEAAAPASADVMRCLWCHRDLNDPALDQTKRIARFMWRFCDSECAHAYEVHIS